MCPALSIQCGILTAIVNCSVDGDGSGGKLHVLSESINDTCSALFQAVATSYDIFPSSMSLLIKAIYEISLDLSAPPMIAVAAVREEATIFPEAVTDDAERLFCTASCGILFLRLLCPALVSPLEWGALREKHRVISTSIGMHVSTSSSPMPAYHSSADSKSESPGPATTFFNSVMDFLAIPYAQPGIMPAVTATNTSTDLAWMDPSDDEAKLAMRSVIDIGSCSAALIIIAHVLMASPQVLKILDLKIQSSLGPMSDEMFFPDDETSDGFRAENHKVPKRRSDPLLSLINIKQFVHTRTWSQPTPIEIDQSSESTSVSVLEMIVRNLSNALPISKVFLNLQFLYVK